MLRRIQPGDIVALAPGTSSYKRRRVHEAVEMQCDTDSMEFDRMDCCVSWAIGGDVLHVVLCTDGF
eukprot:3723500-Amphidinium_carterae.1